MIGSILTSCKSAATTLAGDRPDVLVLWMRRSVAGGLERVVFTEG